MTFLVFIILEWIIKCRDSNKVILRCVKLTKNTRQLKRRLIIVLHKYRQAAYHKHSKFVSHKFVTLLSLRDFAQLWVHFWNGDDSIKIKVFPKISFNWRRNYQSTRVQILPVLQTRSDTHGLDIRLQWSALVVRLTLWLIQYFHNDAHLSNSLDRNDSVKCHVRLINCRVLMSWWSVMIILIIWMKIRLMN